MTTPWITNFLLASCQAWIRIPRGKEDSDKVTILREQQREERPLRTNQFNWAVRGVSNRELSFKTGDLETPHGRRS